MSAQLKLAVPAVLADKVRLADLFHRINRILPQDQEVVTVELDTTVREALKTMHEYGFSQLPVMEGSEVLGVFSHRSFAAKLPSIDSKKHNAIDLLVEETMDIVDPTRFAHINHELSHILDTLERHEAVLVGEPGRLQGIVTTMDVLRYLHVVSSRFVMLGEIELGIRALLKAAMTAEEIEAAATLVLPHYKPERRPTCLEEMTFSDYVQIVGNGRLWEKCRHAFGGDRDRTRVKLMSLAELRNDVFHFKRELGDEDDRQIRGGRDWLLMRSRVLDQRVLNGGSRD